MKTERVFVCLFLLGFFGKMLHLPIAPYIVALTGYAMAFSYFLFGFYFFCDEKIKKQNLALSIIAGVCLSIGPLAFAGKLLYWPESYYELLLSIVLSLIILAFVLFLRKRAVEELKEYYKNMFLRTIAILVVSLILFIMPISTLVHIQYWDNKEFADIATSFYSNPGNAEYKKQYNLYTSTHTPSGKLIKIVPPKALSMPASVNEKSGIKKEIK